MPRKNGNVAKYGSRPFRRTPPYVRTAIIAKKLEKEKRQQTQDQSHDTSEKS